MLIIRPFQSSDVASLQAIKFTTIRTVNRKDYTEAQVQAWAPEQYDELEWSRRIHALSPMVAVLDGTIVGYADLQSDGYIDHFYCHSDYQGQGIGKALMQQLFALGEQRSIQRYYSHVSITARPFFERFGFRVIKQQQVAIRGQTLTNFVMEKLAG